MRIPQLQSAIALALAASLACGCYKTTTAIERVPGTPQRHVLAPKDRGPSLSGSFHLADNAVEGTLAWNRTCQLEERSPVQVQKVTTRKTDNGGNALWVLAAASAVFGGLYAFNDSSNASCSPDTGSCSSNQEQAQLQGMLMIGSGIATISAVALSGRKPAEVGRETIDRSNQSLIVENHAPCGMDADFDGLRLALVLPNGARLVGGVDLSGTVRIPVPAAMDLPDEGLDADIVVDDTPDHLADRVRRGSRLGSIHLLRSASSKRAAAPASAQSRKKI